MAEHPKVFISYSHDSPEHRRWVSELGAKLRHNGVDAILDQWDLGPGDDVTQFMERGIIDSDRVLVVCTDQYVRKANAPEGGVGYERMIVTAQLARDLGTDKFIPIIRQASEEEKTPTFLETRVYIDFTDEHQFESEFEKLIRELHRMPVVERPPLGKNPFAKLPSEQEAPAVEGAAAQLPEIPAQVGSADEAYLAAVKLARAEDEFGWRQLVKQIKPRVFNSLVQWRQNELDEQQPKSKEQLVQVVDATIDIISPLISVALVGIESGKGQFRDQKSTLDDLLNIARWNHAGYTAWWINIPYALGYVYHSLHGSLSLNTNQLDLALNLARVKIPNLSTTENRHVWETGDLIGWSGLFRDNGWEYLVEAYERDWTWLPSIFGDELEYRTSLVAYYMALNIHELASRIALGQQDMLEASLSPIYPFHFTVSPAFLSGDHNITQSAITLLHDQEELAKLWTCLDVTRDQMEGLWETWIGLAEKELWEMAGTPFQPIDNPSLDIFRTFFEGL